jgi:folate-binding protein YgfZ
MDETTLLPETGLERETVSMTKGCYIGQEIIARVDTYGSLSRKLMRLICEGSTVPQPHDPILKEGTTIGEITSACFSPTLQRPIALGYVKRPHYEADTPVDVARAGGLIRGRTARIRGDGTAS